MARQSERLVQLRRDLGAALAGYRINSPFDQGYLARLTNYSRSSISHIEAGRQFPGRQFWEQADKILNTGGVLTRQYDDICDEEARWKIAELERGQNKPRKIGNSPEVIRDSEWQRDDVNRRELLRLITLTGSLLAVPTGSEVIDIDRIGYARANPNKVDGQTLDSYAAVNARLWDLHSASTNKREVLPLAQEQIRTLNGSLTGVHPDVVRKRLCALVGEVFQLCGEIFFDAAQYAQAAHCYSLADYASKEAGTADLWACSMTRHAFIGIYERHYRDTVPLLEGAASIAHRGRGDLNTRYWVAAVQAQAFAGLGDLNSCERALAVAERVRETGGSGRFSGWLRFDASRLDEERGSCYVTLRRPDLAQPVLEKALERKTSVRRRGAILTDLAIVGAHRGDADQVFMYASAALDTVRQTDSTGYVGRKLEHLRDQLEPYRNRQVEHLRAEIDRVIGVSTRKNKGVAQ